MNQTYLYPAGNTAALRYAGQKLMECGYHIVASPAPDVTHLLLPVPSFEPDGRIRGGGVLEHILHKLSSDITIIGGNLNHPALLEYRKIDLLQDPFYLAQNAAITADCAIRIAGQNLPIVFPGCPVLILGWGRIGKCLSASLKALGSDVTVAARKAQDRAMLQALGYHSIEFDKLDQALDRFRIIFNTVPSPVLSSGQAGLCRSDCVKIELASTDGISAPGVIVARGLPGKHAPETSGTLIANMIKDILSPKEEIS